MSQNRTPKSGAHANPQTTRVVEEHQSSTGNHAASTAQSAAGSSAPQVTTTRDDDAGRDSWLGTDHGHRPSNVSWGAIFAGVMTFLAVLVLLGLLATAMGLSATNGTAMGIWSAITLILGLAAAGFVAGALAVRSGLLHGLVTWATSLVGLLIAVALVGTSVLGAVGGVVGGVANTAAQATQVTPEQAQGAAQDAADQAGQAFEENRDELAQGAWWGFGGLLLGALVASLAGVAGARAVHRRETEVVNGVGRRVAA